jgi:hypothetical protein
MNDGRFASDRPLQQLKPGVPPGLRSITISQELFMEDPYRSGRPAALQLEHVISLAFPMVSIVSSGPEDYWTVKRNPDRSCALVPHKARGLAARRLLETLDCDDMIPLARGWHAWQIE